MSEEVYTTQKICLDLEENIRKTEEEIEAQPTLQAYRHLLWLKSKLSFYRSKWYPTYKEQNQ